MSTNSLNTAIERLTTGFRINSAKDDAAGKSVAIDMDVKLSSNEVVQNNVAMGISMLNTAEGNVNLIKNSVQRCRDLCEQALNGVYDTESQNAIKSELTQIVAQVNQAQSTAEFNGISLFEGGGGGSPPVMPTGFKAAVESQNATTTIDATATTVAEAEAALRTALGQSGAVIGISNKLGLQALANVVNGTNGAANMCSGKTIVLTDNIDLSTVGNWTPIGYPGNAFSGVFNGNGYKISNMSISGNSSLGLFGFVDGGTISNTAIVNAFLSGDRDVGILAGKAENSAIINSYATGTASGDRDVGGLVGYADSVTVTNSYATGTVSGDDSIGGLVGMVVYSSVTNSCAYSTVSGNGGVGGLVGGARASSVTDSYATGSVSGNGCVGGLLGSAYMGAITDSTAYTDVSATSSEVGGFLGYSNNTTIARNAYVDDSTGCAVGNVNGDVEGITLLETGNSGITLQIGLDGTENSRIIFNLGLDLSGLDSILSNPASGSNLATLDTILSGIISVETTIGAGLNRLESIQDSLYTQQKTLTAARSVVQDADVSQESARYIRSQILQQASASLLTAANQSPSLLLSLINGMTR